MTELKCNIYLSDDSMVTIVSEDGGEPLVSQRGTITANEHAAVHVIAETMRALATGRPVDHLFNPTINEEEEKIVVKCRWMKSGNLRILDEGPVKKFKHADTLEEALERHRVFTCTRSLLRRLPRKRK